MGIQQWSMHTWGVWLVMRLRRPKSVKAGDTKDETAPSPYTMTAKTAHMMSWASTIALLSGITDKTRLAGYINQPRYQTNHTPSPKET